MRRIAIAALLPLCAAAARAQSSPPPLHSTVFHAATPRTVKTTATAVTTSIMDTVTTTLGRMEMHVTRVAPGQASHAPHRHPDEELIVVVAGTLETMQEGVARRAGPGDVIFQASNELHGLRNVGADTATYYVIRPAPRDLPPARPR